MAAKPQSSNRPPSLVPEHHGHGFWIKLQLPPGMSTRTQTKRLRKLEDAIEDLGLQIGGGTQLHLFIEALGKELSLTDQIDLADWCLLHTEATEIVLTEFTAERVVPPAHGRVLRIGGWDLAAIGVALLYRMGRIKADLYAELLGGFVFEPTAEQIA